MNTFIQPINLSVSDGSNGRFSPTPGELKKAYKLAMEVYQNVIDSMPNEITGKS